MTITVGKISIGEIFTIQKCYSKLYKIFLQSAKKHQLIVKDKVTVLMIVVEMAASPFFIIVKYTFSIVTPAAKQPTKHPNDKSPAIKNLGLIQNICKITIYWIGQDISDIAKSLKVY